MPKKALVRIEEGATAASAAYGCAALLDAELENQLGPAGADGEGLSDAGRLAVRVARRMVYLRHNLETCNEAVARVEDELSRWRRQLDQANKKLYGVAKRLRGLCRHNMPPGEGDEFLGLRGTLPRKPSELHTALSAVVHRLADAEWPMPERQWEWFNIDRQKLVRSLLELHGELGRAIRAVKDGETRESVAKAGRKRVAAAHNAFVGKGSRFLVAALELAGLDDLVATVRPNRGRPGRPKQAKLAAPATPPEHKALPAADALVAEDPAGGSTESRGRPAEDDSESS